MCLRGVRGHLALLLLQDVLLLQRDGGLLQTFRVLVPARFGHVPGALDRIRVLL